MHVASMAIDAAAVLSADAGAAPAESRAAPPPTLDELLARSDLWRGSRLAVGAVPGIASGFASLDALLPGGGWPPGALVEILAGAAGRAIAGNGALSLLLPALARQTQAGGWVVLVAPPFVPLAGAWAAGGVDLSRFIVVAAEARDQFWAIDRSLRSRAIDSLLAWLPRADLTVLRRLQLAAEESRTCFFALRPAACAAQASPAALRLAVTATAGGIAVRILKRRGPLLAQPLFLPLPRPFAARRGGRSSATGLAVVSAGPSPDRVVPV